MDDKSTINKLEQGRAEFAYDCACDGKNISDTYRIETEYFKDDKYKTYVKKVPAWIKTNGLGSTFAFIGSKRQERKDGKIPKIPGEKGNPKNAYDLIYKQTAQWLNDDEKKLLDISKGDDLVKNIISLESPEYRAVTNEVMAFFNWLRRFADGLIEGETGK